MACRLWRGFHTSSLRGLAWPSPQSSRTQASTSHVRHPPTDLACAAGAGHEVLVMPTFMLTLQTSRATDATHMNKPHISHALLSRVSWTLLAA